MRYLWRSANRRLTSRFSRCVKLPTCCRRSPAAPRRARLASTAAARRQTANVRGRRYARSKTAAVRHGAQAKFDPECSRKELIRVIEPSVNQTVDDGKYERGRPRRAMAVNDSDTATARSSLPTKSKVSNSCRTRLIARSACCLLGKSGTRGKRTPSGSYRMPVFGSYPG